MWVCMCLCFTCSVRVESAPSLCRLRHRDAHRALETLCNHDSSESGSSGCLLALPPGPNSTIIHRDTLGIAASISSDSRRQKGTKKRARWRRNPMEAGFRDIYSDGRSQFVWGVAQDAASLGGQAHCQSLMEQYRPAQTRVHPPFSTQ